MEAAPYESPNKIHREDFAMKKIIIVLLLALVLVLFISCTDKDGDTPPEDSGNSIGADHARYSEYYIFSTWNRRLFKYNVITGTATSLHTDPLCDHNHTDCPVSYIHHPIAVFGDFVYFIKQEWKRDESGRRVGTSEENFYKYDYMNDRFTLVISDFSAGLFTVVGDYIYSHDNVLLENGDTGLEFVKYDMKTGISTVLIDAEEAANTMLMLPLNVRISSDRVYWYAINEAGEYIFSTAYDYRDIQSESRAMISIVQGDYAYIPERNYEPTYPMEYYKWFSNSLYRENIHDSSRILLADNVSNFIVDGENIIYFVPVKDPKVAYQSEINRNDIIYHDNYEGKIYIMNTDGSNKRILCEVPDVIISYTLWATNHRRTQEYIAIDLYGDMSGRFEDRSGVPNTIGDPQGYGILPDLLLVNIKTGEYKIAEYIP
jgi:hypothetical protein